MRLIAPAGRQVHAARQWRSTKVARCSLPRAVLQAAQPLPVAGVTSQLSACTSCLPGHAYLGRKRASPREQRQDATSCLTDSETADGSTLSAMNLSRAVIVAASLLAGGLISALIVCNTSSLPPDIDRANRQISALLEEVETLRLALSRERDAVRLNKNCKPCPIVPDSIAQAAPPAKSQSVRCPACPLPPPCPIASSYRAEDIERMHKYPGLIPLLGRTNASTAFNVRPAVYFDNMQRVCGSKLVIISYTTGHEDI